MTTFPWHRRWNCPTRRLNALWRADFRSVACSRVSPDGSKSIVAMLNRCYAQPHRRRVVTLDVRDARGDFMHHIQTDVEGDQSWGIGWCGDDTVIVNGSRSGARAYRVGVDSIVYHLPQPLPDDVATAAAKLA